MNEYIELYTDDELEKLVQKTWDDICEKAECDCDICKSRLMIEEDVCVCEVLMELWRHWRNLKNG